MYSVNEVASPAITETEALLVANPTESNLTSKEDGVAAVSAGIGAYRDANDEKFQSPPITNSVATAVIKSPPTAVSNPSVATLPPVFQVGVIRQDDQSQYLNQAQFQQWRADTCSAASLTSVLVAYGYPTRLGNLVDIMTGNGTLSRWIGLSDNNGFIPTAQKFNLKANIDRNPDTASHYNSILDKLFHHQPVIINVRDGYYYPTGHFLVAYGVNPDGTIAVMNPDWDGDTPSGLQTWKSDRLSLFFSRTNLSVSFSK